MVDRPLDVAKLLEDNCQLKAEVFRVKAELYTYRQACEQLRDKDGVDISREYVECLAKLEKSEQEVAEKAKTIRELIDKQKEIEAIFVDRKNALKKEMEEIASERDFLRGQLNKNPPTVLNVSLSREDGNISQEESSSCDISLMSARDAKIATMESRLLFLEHNEEILKKRHEEEMSKLREELETYKKAPESGDGEGQLNYQVQLKAVEADRAQLVQTYENQIAALKEEYAKNISKRDHMVNVVVRKLRSLNIASFTAEPLADDDGSTKPRSVPDEEVDRLMTDSADMEVAEKMKLYDDDKWMPSQLSDSARAAAPEEVEVVARRFSQRQSNVFNRSLGQLDVTNVQGKFEVCRSTVRKLVFRLRGSADVLQMILKQMGAEQMGKKLYDQIMDLHCDFDQSLTAAAGLASSLDDIERTVWEFSSIMEKSLNVANRSAVPPAATMQCIAEKDEELTKLTEKYEQVVTELSDTIDRMRELEAWKEGAKEEVAKLKEIIAKKEDELKCVHAADIKLQQLSEEREKHVRELGEQLKEAEKRKEQMIIDVKKQRGELDTLNRALCSEREQLKAQLSDKDRLLKEVFSNLDEAKLTVISKEKLLERYDKDQNEVNVKARSLVSELRKLLHSIDSAVNAFGDSPRRTGDDNEVGDGNTAIAKMDRHVDQLWDGFGQLRDALKRREERVRQMEKDLKSMQIKFELAQKEAVGYLSKLKDTEERIAARETKETQTAMQVTSIRLLEADRDRLTAVGKLYDENLGRMQAKLDEGVQERDRLKIENEKLRSNTAASSIAPPPLNQLNKEAMTSLSSTELRNNDELLAAYVSFARHVNDRLLVCCKKHLPRMDRFTRDQLKELEGRLTRVLNLYENQLFELKKQLESAKTDSEKIASTSATSSVASAAEPAQSGSSATLMASKTEAEPAKKSGLSTKEMLNRIAEQVTTKEGAEVFEEAKEIVKMLKSIESTKEEDRATVVKNAAEKARTLRAKLASFCARIEFFEDVKENLDPNATNENLKNENARLRLGLDDAKKTLAKMHDKLREMPSSEAMCEVIVKELKNICDTIKEASTNYKSMRPHRGKPQ